LKAEEIRKFISDNGMIIGIYWDKKSRYSTRGKIEGLENAKLPILVEKVYSRGKLIILESLNNEKKKIYLIFHLKMTGNFTYIKEKHSNLWIEFGKHIGNGYYEEEKTFYFDDSRKFGSFSIYTDLTKLFKKNGPCLFAAAMKHYNEKSYCDNKDIATLEIWNVVLSNKRIQNKPICEFLLEQKHVSGVGNYIRAECLYLAKIHPERKLKDLTEEDKELLYYKTLEVIYLSWKNKGPSAGYIEGGSFKLQVYSKLQDPLQNPVKTYADSKKRTVHYVPNIQI
jgi:formamidopyrimidine-DNA glycosylase